MGGAPRGNENRLRHGLRGAKLPKAARYIEIDINRFRRSLEDAVLATKPEMGVYECALIQSCIRHETRCRLLQRWLKEGQKELKLLDQASLLRELSAATDSRDKVLERLGLNKSDSQTIIDGIYAQPSGDSE